MRKVLFFLMLVPTIGNAQSTNNEQLSQETKKELFAAYQIAERVNLNQLEKSTSEKLDSAVYYEFYDPNLERSIKYEYIYNAQNQQTAEYYWAFDFAVDTIGKKDFSYDQSGKLIELKELSKFSGTWKDQNKLHYSYNISGFLDTIIDSAFNETDGVYELDKTFSFTYNGDNNVSEVFVIREDVVGQNSTVMYPDQQLLYTYDANQNVTNITYKAEVNSTMEDQGIYDFTYTGMNSTGTSLSEYSSWIGSWEDNGDLVKYYDLTVSKSNLILPFSLLYVDYNQKIGEDLVGSYENKLDSLYANDAAGDLDLITYYYYSSPSSSIANIELTKVQLHPNPSTGTVYFTSNVNINSYTVRDLTGKVVAEVNGNIGTSIDLSNLTNGVYQISFKSNSNEVIQTERILIAK